MESLTLAVEVFNRPSPTARTQGVLLNLQHAFEMLFKAVIWEDRKTIQDKGSGFAYSFKTCLNIVRSMGLLDESEAIVAATIDAQRDGVQHQGADVTEERLYLDAASGLRLFDDVLFRVFGERLADYPTFAGRMLPISANPPRELHILTGNDVERVRSLLKPGQRRHAEANALLRTLMVSEQVAADPMGDVEHPTEAEVERFAKHVQKERDWSKLLPGLARLSLEEDEGLTYNLRIVKKGDATAMRIVKPGEPGAEDAMTTLKYNELDRYPFYLSASKGDAQNLVKHTGLTAYELRALIHLLGIRSDEASFKVFKMGSQEHPRYGQKALESIREARDAGRLEEAKEALKAHDRELRESRTG
ncbi:MAG: hypothetical protein JWQ18_2740 [Conexibacter sp.]|nr:hypothetical protein [Conexibacter sp.]